MQSSATAATYYFLGAVAEVSAGPGMHFVSHTGPLAAAVSKSVVGRYRRR